MVYNRCVGTRFCSNNCPYKVRRFNYFDFADAEKRVIKSRNPDVTVRARGVMEKCTFCIQRIAEARVAADLKTGPSEKSSQPVRPPARRKRLLCNVPRYRKRSGKAQAEPAPYALLAEENTKPRVTYEARIFNQNPSISEPPR